MGSFRARTPDGSGVALREVTPSTLMSTFEHEWESPIDHLFYVIPGTLTAPIADSSHAWPLWTRSVLSWEIYYNGVAGAAMEVRISNAHDVGGDLEWFTWRILGISPGSVDHHDCLSGLEIPSGMFAQFRIYAGISAVDVNMYGSLTLRGV